MALFDASRHEPLTRAPWGEPMARAAIERIVRDTHAAFTDAGLWPIHPIDRSPERAAALKPLYYGAAGVIWALHRLHEGGGFELRRDYAEVLPLLRVAHRRDTVERDGKPLLGFTLGDAGIALLQWRLTRDADVEDELHASITAHIGEPAPELGFAWGIAGSMLAALFLYERTGATRWIDAYRAGADALWRRWEYDAQFDCHLWSDDLYGHRDKQLGALHGLAGCVHALWRGSALLDRDRRDELVTRAHRVLRATALRDGAHANWPLVAGPSSRPGADVLRLQHCVGAPGMVNCFARLPNDPHTDALLNAAGELIWRAGPLTKLPSLCHGVPGSGYALLKLFARSGDERWLARARRFAMHAIEQAERGKREHGQRKYSLWTGDLGLAVFLLDCIHAADAMPMLEVF
ncbi:MAG TPA: LanC-like protein [Pseudomonadales bacterium]|nr:LanC-like protein [Pseudomonadales bacterium]